MKLAIIVLLVILHFNVEVECQSNLWNLFGNAFEAFKPTINRNPTSQCCDQTGCGPCCCDTTGCGICQPQIPNPNNQCCDQNGCGPCCCDHKGCGICQPNFRSVSGVIPPDSSVVHTDTFQDPRTFAPSGECCDASGCGPCCCDEIGCTRCCCDSTGCGTCQRKFISCLLYTSQSPRDATLSRMTTSA